MTLQFLLFIVPLTVLGIVFVARRHTMALPLPLGADLAPAFFIQRLAALLIDLVPFAWITALSLGVQPVDAFMRMLEWAFSSQTPLGPTPWTVLIWWAGTLSLHMLYTLVMELLVGRTIGKTLLRLVVVSENVLRPAKGPIVVAGVTRPTRLQILIRNLVRPLELLPPWPLAFVTLLTLKRQRIGDLLTGTVVLRRTHFRPPPTRRRGRSDSFEAKPSESEAGAERDATEKDER